ncbi:MAG: type II toxin-antitoxin system YafQ family toxin [Limosilactobacillus sp.]|nr:type II toxin-antitoxin system YafQ family toxin [Limosilactobacillus sp.]
MNNQWQITYDQTFIRDVKRWKLLVPDLQRELRAIIEYILEYGEIPNEYNPHSLIDPTLPYSGNMDFHLFDGKVDLIVIYLEISKRKVFRFIRLGSHEELFR